MVTPAYCNASVASDANSFTASQLADAFDHVFIANLTQKSIGTDYTYYVFYVIEYLTEPLKTSDIYLLTPGGSEILVSPSPTFYLGVEYLFFCDEITKEHRITGNKYQYKLLDSIDSDEIEDIRKSLQAERAATTEQVVAQPENAVNPDNIAEEAVEPLIDPEAKPWDFESAKIKQNKADENKLLAFVFLCFAGMYLVLLPVLKKGI